MLKVGNSHSGVEFNYEAADNLAAALTSTHGTISYCLWPVALGYIGYTEMIVVDTQVFVVVNSLQSHN